MKRNSGAVFGVLLAGVLAAQAQMTSINTVGYTKLTLERGKIYLLSCAFDDADGAELKAANIFGNQLPNGTQVFTYDGTTPYVVDTKTIGGWSGNITFEPHKGFWVRIPSTASEASYAVTLKGSAPKADSATYSLANGLNLLGYPYAKNVPFGSTGLAAQGVPGDRLTVYDATTQSYGSGPSTRTIAGWSAGAQATVLDIGEGFWYYNSKSPSLVTESRPY